MTEEEAQQQVMLDYAKRIGLSVAGGAVSGGVTGGGASVYNQLTGNNQNTVTEQENQNEIPVLESEPEVNPNEQFTQDMQALGLNDDGTLLQASGESLNNNVENTTAPDDNTTPNEADTKVPTIYDYQQELDELKAANTAFVADLSKYGIKQQETVKRAMESGLLNNTNATHQFVDMIAKISADKGVTFDFTNNKKLQETGFVLEGKTVNGYVTNGNIVINLDSAQALNTVVGHEITHVLEGTALYAELQKAIREYATTKGEYNARLQRIQQLYEGVDNADIANEITADLVGEYLFTDADFINKLSVEKPGLFRRIYEEIKYLYKLAIAGSKEARELEKVKRAFEKAYNATPQNVDSEHKYALEDIANMSEKVYNHHGWAKVNDVLDSVEMADFMSKTGDKARNKKEWFRKLGNNRHMFEVGHDGVNNTLVIGNGSFENPSIEKIYHINLDSETDIEIVRDAIYESEKDGEWALQSNVIKEIFGDDLVSVNTVDDFGTFQELSRKRKGTESKGDTRSNTGLQNGSGSNQGNRNSLSNKASSKDGVFYSVSEQSLEDRLSGDALLDAQDLIAEIESVAEISPDGYVTLYHRTTPENAKKIVESGKMSAKEDGIFFSTKNDGANSVGYGDGVVKVKIPVEKLVLDDIFSDEAHLRVPLKNKNATFDVSGYLVNGQYSLSDNHGVAPVGNYNVYGKDIALERNQTVSTPKSNSSRTMAEDTGARNTSNTVVELEGKVRGYNESIVNKSDLPTEIKNEFINNPQFYEVLSNKTTLENANAILENSDTRSATAQFNRLIDQKNPVAVPLGYNLAKQLQQEGSFDEAVEVLRKMSEKLTEAGQFTQAAAITLMHGDPTTALQYLTREIDRLNAKGKERYGNKWTNFELTEAEQQELSSLDVGDEQGIKNVYEKVFARIRQQYPATMREKLTELRRISMLLNMRTNVRNVVSNALLLPVRWSSDRISALGEGVMHLVNPEYKSSQALYVNRQSKALAKEAWNTVKDTLLEDGKYEDVNGAVRDKQVFKGSKVAQAFDNITNGALTKANEFLGKKAEPSLLETARNFTYWLLKQGDDVFVKKNFVDRMASYLSAQKINDLDSIPADAYTLATQEALKATFKDDNSLTKMFSAIKKNTGLVGEVILPFTKTPANLAMRGYDYSIGGYIELFRTLSNSKSRTWTDVTSTMDSLSKSVLGTGAIALGYALAAAGFITGPLSDDEDEAAFQKAQGMLPYSLHIGDNYYTYDWAQPAAIPLILGATIYNSTKESDSLWNGIYQGSLAAVDSWFSLSPLQNVQEIFGGYGTPAENIADTLLETPLSFIPAQMGALARTADTTQRVTYSNGNPLETLANSAVSRIPFLSESLPAAYDTWGNEIQRSDTTGEAAFAQLLNPGQVGNSNITPIDNEISRLYDSTGNSAVFPQKVNWSYTIDGESVKLDNEQYSEMQRLTGLTSYDAAEHFINSSYYNSMSDDTRADILGDIYSFAQANAKHEMFGYDIANNDTYKKKYEAYQTFGAEGVVDYMGYKEMADEDGSGTLTQEEIKGFLSAQPNLTQSEKADWFDIYFPKAKVNPFR